MWLDALESFAEESLANVLQDTGWLAGEQLDDESGVVAFARQEVEDVVYQLDLLRDVKVDSINFSVILGVRHVELSVLVSRLLGRAGVGRAATFGRSLIDLLPHISPADLANRWRVRSEVNLEVVVEKAIGDLETFGMPFLRSFRNLEDIILYLETERRYQMMSGQLAVACGLAGRRSEAEDALREYVNAAQNQRGAMLQQSQNFLSNFTDHFGFGTEF